MYVVYGLGLYVCLQKLVSRYLLRHGADAGQRTEEGEGVEELVEEEDRGAIRAILREVEEERRFRVGQVVEERGGRVGQMMGNCGLRLAAPMVAVIGAEGLRGAGGGGGGGGGGEGDGEGKKKVKEVEKELDVKVKRPPAWVRRESLQMVRVGTASQTGEEGRASEKGGKDEGKQGEDKEVRVIKRKGSVWVAGTMEEEEEQEEKQDVEEKVEMSNAIPVEETGVIEKEREDKEFADVEEKMSSWRRRRRSGREEEEDRVR